MLKRLLKEPLLHFLLLGVGLFVLYGYVAEGDAESPNRIRVDRDDLLTFMQYRAKAFEADRFNELLDNMPKAELQSLIADYVREEALYREAKALKLDSNDYVARRRLIQQLEFITRGFVDAAVSLSDADVQDYYEAHKADYYEPPKITFTHVFFSSDRHGREEATRLAQNELRQLNDQQIPFHQSMAHGDRFLYHTNYVEKEADEIASHFGVDMQQQLFTLTSDDNQWYGPFQSPYGAHLVMVAQRMEGRTLPLAEIRPRVEQDAARVRSEAELDKAIQSIVDTYDVDVVDIQHPVADKKDA